MNISDRMKRKVIYISREATVQESVQLMVHHHIGTLPVVDASHQLVGLVRLRTLLSLVMPDFVDLLDRFNFVHDFGAVEARQPTPEELNRPVREIMTEPISCDVSCSLLHAAALLHHHTLQDLPVVDEAGRLVGIASHVDIGTALIHSWNVSSSGDDATLDHP